MSLRYVASPSSYTCKYMLVEDISYLINLIFVYMHVHCYKGHKGAVRSLASADGEHYFVSGSRDRTAKVWSVRNHGNNSGSVGCRLTYGGHQKPVFAIELMENLDSVVSCDGTVHVSRCIREVVHGRSEMHVYSGFQGQKIYGKGLPSLKI